MAKVTIDWGEDYQMDEFKVSYPIARAVFTLLSRVSDTWAKWQPVKHDETESLTLNDINKITEFRKDEENKTPEL